MKKVLFLPAIFLFFISCKSINTTSEKFSFHLQESSQKLLVEKYVTVFRHDGKSCSLTNEFIINRNISINDDFILVNKEILPPEEQYKKGPYLLEYGNKYRLKKLPSNDYYAENSITGQIYSESDSSKYNPKIKTFIEDLYIDKNDIFPVFLSLFDYSFSFKDDNITILLEDNNIENISKLMSQTTDFDFSESEYNNYLSNSEFIQNELTTETFNEYQVTINLLNDKTFRMHKKYPFVYELRLIDNEKPIYVPTSFEFWKSYAPTEVIVHGGCGFYDKSNIPALPKSIKKIYVGYHIRCTKELKIIECQWARTIIYNEKGREIPITYSTKYKTIN